MQDASPTRVQHEAGIAVDRRRDRVAWVCAAALLVSASVLTVLRRTVPFLNADGVQQSVASVQKVTLFFWGQDRFASVVSLVASPIANPTANLWACLLLNALAFHGLLLLIAWLGSGLVGSRSGADQRSASTTLLLFCAMTATAHLVLAPSTVHQLAIESQPFALSWLAALGSVHLWRRGGWWCRVVSVLLVGLAVGLNQLALAPAAALAVVDAARLVRRNGLRGVLRRWVPYAAAWCGWIAVWSVLGSRYGGAEWPFEQHSSPYLTFDLVRVWNGSATSLAAIVGAFRPTPTVLLLALGACATAALLPSASVVRLVRAGAVTLVFATAYWLLLTGNAWVEANLFLVRYFFPVVICGIVVQAVGLLLALHWAVHAVPAARAVAVAEGGTVLAAPVRWVAPGLAAISVIVLSAGSLQAPTQAVSLTATRATGDFAREHGVRFIAGSFWTVLPTLHRVLEDGRDSAFSLSSKSSGDRAAYRRAFEEASQDGPVLALCVGSAIDLCVQYLDFWTSPGWSDRGEDCPAPAPHEVLAAGADSCRVLVHPGGSLATSS